MNSNPELHVRQARTVDIVNIQYLIKISSRSIGTKYYARDLVEAALNTVLGVDTQLIRDGTYFVAEQGNTMLGCGGWSRRRTLFGSDSVRGRDDDLLNPATDAAKIRAFFVHPDYVRHGVGSRILDRCEREARNAGFLKLELGATLSGTAFYLRHGFVAGTPYDYECTPGMNMEIVPMSKGLEG